MAQAEALAGLQAETKCPICLDILTDPVTIECGHNFCQSCIKDFWAVLPGRFSCPVCRHQCQKQIPRCNTQLGMMIEAAQRLHSRKKNKSEGQESSTSCEMHNEVLTLFCEDDLQLLCDQCIGPASHNGHQVTPIVQAASHRREKLQGFIKLLECKMKEAEESISIQKERTEALSEEADAQRGKLTAEFEQLNWILYQEQQAAFSRLEDQEMDTEQKLLDNIAAFKNYGSKLRDLLSPVFTKRELSEAELLSTVKDFHQNVETEISPPPFCVQFRRDLFNFPLEYLPNSALERVIKQFTEQVTLDLETAHPNLLVSEDKKCVTFVNERQCGSASSKRFTKSPVVLGFPYFSSGRHFWEVQVGKKAEWAVGICKADLPIRERQSSIPQGCWRIVWQGDHFDVSGADPDSQFKHARAIGVFLDCELGELSFYCMPERCHIYTFSDTFPGAVCPYFYIGPRSEPLRLCSATGSE
ncbi:tripartite motif-containing protein 75-like [Acomys russatus]|uniref:tripartite motif-containing protein 75-like n=1 Tax=Acomys russatus TaxID=60746 RepID=UPI0021E2EEDF|nr:tripartite motif-containing protein 75-like [Acomys russatus]